MLKLSVNFDSLEEERNTSYNKRTVSLYVTEYKRTEDHVKTIRFMNAVRDNLSSDEDTTIITSGSYGEGLEMRGSDLDIMFVDKRIKVDEDVKPRLNPNVPIITMKTDDVKPGYTQLEVEYNRDQYFSKCCEELNGKHYISSTLFKQQFLIG
ncbi:unnamed protein product [Mytilus edulis]|uniref:Uncharacterized protein n=1 Tax=Mytilus edulis TaxID=6550 RepID=A0A8S3UFV1_MYTED|nr:unnamed protein product [Mytilus edulis]